MDEMAKNEGRFDIILEMVADKNLQNDLKLLNTTGRIMVISLTIFFYYEPSKIQVMADT